MPMSPEKVRITKTGWDWHVYCPTHHLSVWCEVWDDAYELACGHLCLFHPKEMVA